MKAGPLYSVAAAAANTSVICLACSAWLTPSGESLVGAPNSVSQIFLLPSPCPTITSCMRPTSDQPLAGSAVIPVGDTYGWAAAASKKPPAPAAYICSRKTGGEYSPSPGLNPANTTVLFGWMALMAG